MDPYEATKVVFSRVQNLDPQNASKIMGLFLIQEHGEKEMIRLAFGPESLLHSEVVKARQELGISPNTPSTTTATTTTNNNNSSRFLPLGLKIPSSLSIPTLGSPCSTTSPVWKGLDSFCDVNQNNRRLDDVLSPSISTLNPSTPPFYSRNSFKNGGNGEFLDEFQLQEQLSFLNGADVETATWGGGSGVPHRRSCSVSDINLASLLDDPNYDPNLGFGWKPCLYYARGFCKNGSSCRFVHNGEGESGLVGSPSKIEMMEHCHQLLRSKSMHHQHKLIAAAMGSGLGSGLDSGSGSLPYSLSNKGLNLFTQQQQNDSPRAAMMMGEDLHKFSRSPRGFDNIRSDLSAASRQIYLTFPADSTFREEDVSNYFSIYGPVEDVRIPYQQKRMFGFVTFVYPETVKLILAKGNPHFVCDARVLVKPYKEKGKVPDKFRKQQLMERGEYLACNSPTSLDSRDPFDLPLGERMMYDTQYILWRRKLEEQADLQQALELQSRRLMDLHLLDVKRNHHHRSLSTGAPPIHSPTQSPNSIFNQPLLSSDRSSPDASDENCGSPPLNEAKQVLLQKAINEAMERGKGGSVGGEENSNNGSCKENPCHEDNIINLPESLEHNLPDSPFASPKKGAHNYISTFMGNGLQLELSNPSTTCSENNPKASSLLPPTTTLDMAPLKSSCYYQMPRFSPGHGAIGM